MYYGGTSCDVLTRGYVVYIMAVFAEEAEDDSGYSRSTWPVMNPLSSLSGPKTLVFIKCAYILSQLVAAVYKMAVNLTHALSCRQTSGPALGVSNKWLSSLIIMLLVYIL